MLSRQPITYADVLLAAQDFVEYAQIATDRRELAARFNVFSHLWTECEFPPSSDGHIQQAIDHPALMRRMADLYRHHDRRLMLTGH